MSLENFLNLPDQKQKDILRAALREFSQYGYDLASTNRIVAGAGISKGVLFKYFPSKADLFFFIVENFQDDQMLSVDNLSNYKDIFDFIEFTVRLDIEKVNQNEEEKLFYSLVNKMARDPDHPIYARALSGYWAQIDNLVGYYCDHLDENLLRQGITPPDVKKILSFLLDSMRIAMNKKPDRLYLESDKVIDDARLILSVVRTGIFISNSKTMR